MALWRETAGAIDLTSILGPFQRFYTVPDLIQSCEVESSVLSMGSKGGAPGAGLVSLERNPVDVC